MTKLKTFSLALLGCVALTACGSSGGSDDNKSSVESKVKDTANQVKNEVSNAITPTTGKAIVFSGQDEKAKAKLVDINEASLTEVKVDGKTFTISMPGIFAGTWSKIDSSNKMLQTCCGKFSDVRFGVVGDSQSENIFVNGNPTKNMPTQGVANYTGYTLITANNEKFANEDYLTGTNQFTADFGSKTLTGTLSVDTLQPINVEAQISSNDFSGKATSAEFATQANVTGKFYGDNAKELGGVFKDDSAMGDNNAWGGAFGAAKK